MEKYDIYKDISERTDGSVFLGVIGPVRTGKSTFIKRFMDMLVIPNIENEYSRERAVDELPQSSAGKTIMTTEPKFVPSEAVDITVAENVEFKVRLIDCVGYIVKGASGYMDGENARMVNTPWSDTQMPFAEAAEIGTKKVITEHSTVGVLVTTDGSFSDLTREEYVEAEERVVHELQDISKPFVIVLNTTKPYAPETAVLRQQLADKYTSPVVAMNVAQLKEEDVNSLMETMLYEFPLNEVRINYPKWIETLDINHWMKQHILKCAKELMKDIHKLRDVKEHVPALQDGEHIKKAVIEKIDLGSGAIHIEMTPDETLFYRILSESCDLHIENDYQLIATIQKLAATKKEYDKIASALEEVNQKGYGIVSPSLSEMSLEEPQVMKQGSRYGIKLKASAPSIHMIKADIETEVSPIVGSEKQSQDLLDYLMTDYDTDPTKIWDSNIFGKSLHEMVTEGLNSKLYHMPEDAQVKLQETLQKIINEGSGGMICIML